MPERAKDTIIVLADVSSSMGEADGGAHEKKTRFDLLIEALRGLPKEVVIITFSDNVREIGPEGHVHLYGGGTALHLGIDAAAKHKPVRTVIVSDGEPDSEGAAREALEKLTGIVDVVFCGNPGNVGARRFLESLARAGAGGFYQTGDEVDVAKQLPAVITGLLGS